MNEVEIEWDLLIAEFLSSGADFDLSLFLFFIFILISCLDERSNLKSRGVRKSSIGSFSCISGVVFLITSPSLPLLFTSNFMSWSSSSSWISRKLKSGGVWKSGVGSFSSISGIIFLITSPSLPLLFTSYCVSRSSCSSWISRS